MSSLVVLPLVVFWLVGNMVLFFAYQVVIFLAFWPWNLPLYRTLMGQVQTAWVDVIAVALPPADLVITGQLPTDLTKPAIVLCNHQIDTDWWFLWELARRHGGGGRLKICLKHELKLVPVFGWGLSLFEFLFVRRNLDADRMHVAEHMASLGTFPFWMLLFPEGTTITTEAMAKSHRFAKAAGRPTLAHTLLPRTAGLETMLAATAAVQPDVYDLTMAYPGYGGEVPTNAMGYSRTKDVAVPSMAALIFGRRGPTTVHMHGCKVAYADVAGREQQFLDHAWAEKDGLMEEFIHHQCFHSKQEQNRRVVRPVTSWWGILCLWWSALLAFLALPVVLVVAIPRFALLGVSTATSVAWQWTRRLFGGTSKSKSI
ncbi:Aste57867_19273 [Aphanomyces stellatus]|uniref:Aste57867_19273 protein n=1 Tax=Aphanomyces stellatus TaxID=120398 RepID=A0A485LDL6_9STRA|nr:hypothetical protein As57867_019209 [Aphanomyces stellatus]VFT95993.1 Aste57867_19273 [Aphanomyces stellatus]